MTPAYKIKKFIRLSYVVGVLMSFLKGFLLATPLYLVGILVSVGVATTFQASVLWSRLSWIVIVLTSVVCGLRFFWPISFLSLLSRSICLKERFKERGISFREDDLVVASQFLVALKNDSDRNFKDRFLSDVAERLEKGHPSWCYQKWPWFRSVVILIFVVGIFVAIVSAFPSTFPLSKKTFFPFSHSNFEGMLFVSPGNAKVVYGANVQIRITTKEGTPRSPVLYLQSGSSWSVLDPEEDSTLGSNYTIKNLIQPLTYKVFWKGEWSVPYKLIPMEPFQINGFKIKITPPAYVSLGVFEQDQPEIRAFSGSKVELEAKFKESFSKGNLIFENGSIVPAQMLNATTARFVFYIDKDDAYTFNFESEKGEKTSTREKYSIYSLLDENPTVQLVSPDDDLIVGEKDRIPLVVDGADDIGMGTLTLVWTPKGGKTNRKSLISYSVGVKKDLSTFDWNLREDKLKAGDVIDYYIELVDRNTVTGPGVARSVGHVLELRGFEAQHEQIEASLNEWREKAVETLAQINKLDLNMEKTEKLMPEHSKEFEITEAAMAELERSLKKILSQMEKDPLADYGVWLEHNALHENLVTLNQSTVRNTRSAMQTQNKPAAQSGVQELGGELERMIALSENLKKTQNMQDVMNASDRISEIGEQMIKDLDALTPEKEIMKKKINDLLDEAKKNLREMAQLLQKMPEDLPEDFVNQEALKSLNMGKSEDLMSKIEQAMESGDFKKALELAKSFLEASKKMREQLGKANDGYMESHSMSRIEAKMTEMNSQLDAFIQGEREILSRTQKLAIKEMTSLLKAQEDLLARLAIRQANLNIEMVKGNQSNYWDAVQKSLLVLQLQSMQKIEAEFKRKRLDESPVLLADVVSKFQSIQDTLFSTSTSIGLAKLMTIKDEQLNIWNQLKELDNYNPAHENKDKNEFEDLRKAQNKLGNDLKDFKKEVQSLSRKTALLGTPFLENLNGALSDMESASNHLGNNKGRYAQLSEESALSRLMDGQGKMTSAQGNISEMSSQQGGAQGKPGGMRQVIQRSGLNGQQGMNRNKVVLPRSEDFKAPKAFREDLLESLKEKYPKIYEKIIHNYFKSLVD